MRSLHYHPDAFPRMLPGDRMLRSLQSDETYNLCVEVYFVIAYDSTRSLWPQLSLRVSKNEPPLLRNLMGETL